MMLKQINNMIKKDGLSIALVAVIAVLLVWCWRNRSGMRLSPGAVMLEAPGASPDGIFKLPDELRCVPGPAKDASYYSKDLTPGGLCGAQKWVNDQMRYKITGSEGDSLLN